MRSCLSCSFPGAMNLLNKIISGTILFLCIAVWSPISGEYRFDNWTTDNGLPQNGVRQITQTKDGYLWFTTFDGLVRFDGVRFTTFNKSNTKGIINNRFTGIFADVDGAIYATTMEDGILTIYRDGAFTSLTSDEVPGHYISKIERVPGGELRFLVEDDDRTTKSWYRLIGRTFEFIEREDTSPDPLVINGKLGSVWKVTQSGVTETKNGATFYTPLDLSSYKLKPNLFEDNAGTLWVGENRVHHIANGKIRTFDQNDGLVINSIYHSFWQEPDGSVWLASGGASSTTVGLVQVKDDTVALWGSSYGLTATSIQDIYNDREGTTWLATDHGLYRRRNAAIQSFSKKDGLGHSEVYPIYRTRSGDVWIGTSKGMSIYRDGVFKPYDIKPAIPDGPRNLTWESSRVSVQSLWEDNQGKMWVGINGGIFIVENGIAKNLIVDCHVFSIKGDRSGNVWAATNKGIYQFNDYKLTRLYNVKDGLPNEFMTLVFEDSKGSIWFGGYGGLSKFENGRFTNYTTRDGLTGNYVRTIYEDTSGTFWIGTYDEGMSRFKDGKFVNYKETDGLYNSGVFAIEEDTAGFFWISSNRGIYRVNRAELEDFAAGNIKRINSVGYGKEDGMLSTECNGGRQPASLRTDDGKFWFPTQDGIAVVDPLSERSNPMPPTVVIEDISVERSPVDFRNGIKIEAGKKDIEIRYTGISLIKSEQIKFQYKLDGYDDDWVEAGTRRTAFYSYLPPGNYTFRVRAANSYGVWSNNDAETTIELEPFFYQTTLFYLVAALVVLLVLLVIWKISFYQLVDKERKLKKLVAERTAELAWANEHLESLANSDGLTKIGNRRRFESFLADEWHRAIRFRTEISLALIDIDHFKLFNDTYGHQAGDDCLQRVAQAFADTLKRPTDLVARFGGEEFALILGGTDSAGALSITEEAVSNVTALGIRHSASSTSDILTVSVGLVTMRPVIGMSEDQLISTADRALYQAKKSGRDQIVVIEDLSADPVAAGFHLPGDGHDSHVN